MSDLAKQLIEKTSYMNDVKQAIKRAIQDKGQTIEDDLSFYNYSDKIRQITTSEGMVKLFETEEEMQSDSTSKEGDLAVVYRNEVQNMSINDQSQYLTFPESVILPEAFTDNVYCMLRSVDDTIMLDVQIMLNDTRFQLDCWGSDGYINITYESSDGINYTRTIFTGSSGSLTNPVDLTTPVKVYYEEEWNDILGYFMQIEGNYFGGLYKYQKGEDKDKLLFVSDIFADEDSFGHSTSISQYVTRQFINSGVFDKVLNNLPDNTVLDSLLVVTDYTYGYDNQDIKNIQCFAFTSPTGVYNLNKNTLYACDVFANGPSDTNQSYAMFKAGYEADDTTTDFKMYRWYFNEDEECILEEITDLNTFVWQKTDNTEYNKLCYSTPLNSYWDLYAIQYKNNEFDFYPFESQPYNGYGSHDIGLSFYEYEEYRIADNQYNLENSNQLLPEVKAYGKTGNITGDESVYDNLDANTLAEKLNIPLNILCFNKNDSYGGFRDNMYLGSVVLNEVGNFSCTKVINSISFTEFEQKINTFYKETILQNVLPGYKLYATLEDKYLLYVYIPNNYNRYYIIFDKSFNVLKCEQLENFAQKLQSETNHLRIISSDSASYIIGVSSHIIGSSSYYRYYIAKIDAMTGEKLAENKFDLNSRNASCEFMCINDNLCIIGSDRNSNDKTNIYYFNKNLTSYNTFVANSRFMGDWLLSNNILYFVGMNNFYKFDGINLSNITDDFFNGGSKLFIDNTYIYVNNTIQTGIIYKYDENLTFIESKSDNSELISRTNETIDFNITDYKNYSYMTIDGLRVVENGVLSYKNLSTISRGERSLCNRDMKYGVVGGIALSNDIVSITEFPKRCDFVKGIANNSDMIYYDTPDYRYMVCDSTNTYNNTLTPEEYLQALQTAKEIKGNKLNNGVVVDKLVSRMGNTISYPDKITLPDIKNCLIADPGFEYYKDNELITIQSNSQLPLTIQELLQIFPYYIVVINDNNGLIFFSKTQFSVEAIKDNNQFDFDGPGIGQAYFEIPIESLEDRTISDTEIFQLNYTSINHSYSSTSGGCGFSDSVIIYSSGNIPFTDNTLDKEFS